MHFKQLIGDITSFDDSVDANNLSTAHAIDSSSSPREEEPIVEKEVEPLNQFSDEEEEELMVGEDEDENGEPKKQKRKKFNPNNECELIWTGMAVKRAFHTFMFQSAQSPAVARKILEAKGVAHYWDLCVGLAERKEGGDDAGMRFRLGDGTEDDDDVMASS